MKRASLIIIIGLSIVCIGLLFSNFQVVVVAGPQPQANENGDVDGDGRINIADPIYLLVYMFKGGPKPVALAAPQELEERVANIENEVGGVAEGLNALAVAIDGLSNPERDPCTMRLGRFIDNGDGTVSDLCTGLMWQRGSGSNLTREEAADYCENLDLADKTDWRLPSIMELETIFDFGKGGTAANPTNEHFTYPLFSGNRQYWSNTGAWMIDFTNRSDSFHIRTTIVSNRISARAVRDLNP